MIQEWLDLLVKQVWMAVMVCLVKQVKLEMVETQEIQGHKEYLALLVYVELRVIRVHKVIEGKWGIREKVVFWALMELLAERGEMVKREGEVFVDLQDLLEILAYLGLLVWQEKKDLRDQLEVLAKVDQ